MKQSPLIGKKLKKKKLEHKKSFLGFLGTSSRKKDKQLYEQLIRRLRDLQSRDNIDLLTAVEIQKIKEQINKIRQKYGLLSFAQLKEIKDLNIKPYKYPGDPDPAQNITICPICNSAISEKDGVPYCPNCKKIVNPNKGNPYQRKVPQKGERYKDFGPKDTVINPTLPVSSVKKVNLNKNSSKKKKKNDIAEKDKTIVKDVFRSDEFNMCREPIRKTRKNDDNREEEIMKSCKDLEIDG